MRPFIAIITLTLIIFSLIVYLTQPALIIIDTPISFGDKRVEMTKTYIKTHYDLNVSTIDIDPKMIVLHWSEEDSLESTYELFNPEEINATWGSVSAAGQVNVSAHFLVDREGAIYRLMPETQMARHVIGLNYSSIGIENVGGGKVEGIAQANLTQKQYEANVRLVAHLKQKFPKIRYLIGHYEYRKFENHPLWLEKDPAYRTEKSDPDPEFVDRVYNATKDLGLLRAP